MARGDGGGGDTCDRVAAATIRGTAAIPEKAARMEGVRGTSAAGGASRAVAASPAGRAVGCVPAGGASGSGCTVDSSTTNREDVAASPPCRPRKSYCPTRQGGKHAAGW